MSISTVWLHLMVWSLCLLALFSVEAVQGATQTVTNTNDSGSGSLRQAIATAAVDDTIQFDSTLSGQTLTLNSRLPLTKNLTIDGTALATALTIDGNGTTQLFAVHEDVTATLTGLTLANANANFGGAVYNQGDLSVQRVTFVNNHALQGGAIYNVGALTISNSTFHGNSAFNGGALSNLGSATLRNNTLIGNSSFNPGGGIDNANELALYNTIIAGSTTGGDCVNDNNPQLDLYGTLTANVHNLIEDGSCEATFTGDPGLSTLSTVDGALVYMPLAGSPVLDAGDDTSCTAVDQRAAPRPQGAACEIGAVEWIPTRLITENLVIEDGHIAQYNEKATPCTDQPELSLPIHTITPTLRNHSSERFRDLYFVITELRYTATQGDNTPTLCNADGGQDGGVDAMLTVDSTGNLADQILAPDETFTQPIEIGLPVRARYRISANLYGTATTAMVPNRNEHLPIGTLHWEFDEAGNLVDENDTDTSVRIFLPVVVR